MNESYLQHVSQRAAQNLPPLPLSAEQTRELCQLLGSCKGAEEHRTLLADRVSPGVDPAAKVKADFLRELADGNAKSCAISPADAVMLLGTMMGGYNLPHLIDLLDHPTLAANAAEALKGILLVFDSFRDIREKMGKGNPHARAVITSWAEAEWFTRRAPLPEEIRLVVYKVEGEVNTDDLSPAGHAPSRPDIPLHALSMGETRFPGGIAEIAKLRKDGYTVAFASDTLGTGSSRKSATNSIVWHIGDDIPFVPNKRRGGVALGTQIAPIFFNTFEDSGGLPVRCDVSHLATGQKIVVRPYEGKVLSTDGKTLSTFSLSPQTLPDEYRAGGRVPLIIGRKLTSMAREALRLGESKTFILPPVVTPKAGQGYTLAQKMVGRACGITGVLPGQTCEPKMTTVGSQDTTGPMTRDELTELACLRFQAGMTMQSFCHTAAYPKEKDKAMHASLPGFITSRGGVALKPGDGIIHSWLNRLLVPDTVGTGGDSHTRFPVGISFAAGSGLVAFAAALGCMPLDMPESVLVKFSGAFPVGVTLRDAVNAIALFAIEAGLQSPFGKGTDNVFNSRILEMEGTESLTVEQAFELSCAAAERSAAAATLALSNEAVCEYLRSNVTLMKTMIADGYADRGTLARRIEEVEAWLKKPELLKRDANAEFASTLEIDLARIKEPVLACPNNPDNVAWLSAHAGRRVDEVFIGSCMTNIGHFRAAGKIFGGPDARLAVRRLWITPPTRMDFEQLSREGVIQCFEKFGARIEVPGCSLCMGNQARVDNDAVVFATSTRNFNNRMGDGAQVYLGSAELAAVVAKLGRIPTPEEYFAEYRAHIEPYKQEVYSYLYFHRMDGYRARAATA